MSRIVKNVFWKEFHELKSATIAATAITLSLPLTSSVRDRHLAFDWAMGGFWVYPLFAGVFFGMRMAAGERANRVGSFVAALPVSYRLLGAIRLVATSIAAALPLVALLGLGLALSFERSFVELRASTNGLLLAPLCVLSVVVTIVLLSIVAGAGIGQPTEIRAGAVGVLALLGLWLLWVSVIIAIEIIISAFRPVDWGPDYQRWEYVMQAAPPVFTLVAVISLIILSPIIFVLRYGRTLGPFDTADAKWWPIASWLQRLKGVALFVANRRPTLWPNSAVIALVWKAVREIGFVGLLVFLIALAFVTLGAVLGISGNQRFTLIGRIAETLPWALFLGGFVLAILIGVGAAIGDVQAGVNTFWRSRPIPPGAWYWTKYAVGLLTIFFAVEVPTVLCIGYQNPMPEQLFGWLFWMLICNTTFSLALTATCLVRQALQAAILATGAAGLLFAAVQAIFATGPDEPGPSSVALPVFVFAFIAAMILSTFAGAWAAKHDVAIS